MAGLEFKPRSVGFIAPHGLSSLQPFLSGSHISLAPDPAPDQTITFFRLDEWWLTFNELPLVIARVTFRLLSWHASFLSELSRSHSDCPPPCPQPCLCAGPRPSDLASPLLVWRHFQYVIFIKFEHVPRGILKSHLLQNQKGR